MENSSTKKTSIGLIIGFIATMVAIVGVGVTLAIVLISQNSSSSPSSGSGSTNNSSNNGGSSSNKQDDAKREDDLSRILVSANSYMMNNSGKTPWAEGSTNKNFVYRYIDENCTAKTPEKADSNCGENFSDPDGEPYFFVYEGKVTSSKTVKLSKNHGIYVYTKAMCGADSGEVKVGSSEREIALFYKLSDGSIACSDNQ